MFHHQLKNKACSEKISREKDVLSETDSFRDNKTVHKPVPGAAVDSHCHLWPAQSLSVSGSTSVTQGLQPPAVYYLSDAFKPCMFGADIFPQRLAQPLHTALFQKLETSNSVMGKIFPWAWMTFHVHRIVWNRSYNIKKPFHLSRVSHLTVLNKVFSWNTSLLP